MALRPRYLQVSRVAVPARAMAQRFALVLLLAAAITLLVLGKTHTDAVSRMRMAAIDVIAPVLDVMSRPVEAARQLVGRVQDAWYLFEENDVLRQQQRHLLHWQTIARRLEQENAHLRAQLNLVSELRPGFVSARVIGDSGGSFVQTRLINAGEGQGVLKGQAAVNGVGLAGRVVETGKHSARLLLLTDLNSRVPVVVQSSRFRAVLAGDNSSRPRLIFLPTNAKVSPGERIVTSGHGGVFPPGIPVGMVASVSEGDVRVQPFVDWDRLEYVSVLRYQMPRLDTDIQDQGSGS